MFKKLTPSRRHKGRPALRLTLGLAALATAWSVSGCETVGYVTQAINADQDVQFQAKYRGLENKRVAVLVDAPMDVQFDYQNVVPGLCELISGGIHQYVEGTKVRPPMDVVAFLSNNVYWPMMDPAELAKKLDVQRLVLVDIVEYRLTTPGNSYLWDGVVIAEVGVIEADGVDSSAPVFSERITARFPVVDNVGRDKASATDIERGLQVATSQKIVRLFYDYTRKSGDIDKEQRRERLRQ